MISENEVERIAALARLKLNEKEKQKFQKELSLILDYVAQLNELPIENVSPTTSGIGAINIMRPDKKREEDNTEQVRAMLEQAPETKDGFLKVKAILKQE
ncbi:MAG: Asp-tRNA(Asn)/Glu-tRNA(Gln) amidotransferase subunit GatC [bacterium]|nr:Asp-tRNA(Asn)/Glu-tRNA(Gln) amidotransferase subunit GatC [bacterium]